MDIDLKRDRDTSYNEAYSQWAQWLPEAYKDTSYYLGNQWTDQEIKDFRAQNRDPVVYNKCKVNVKLVTGFERRNRMSSIIRPQNQNDKDLADTNSDLILWAYKVSGANYKISQSFRDACITGLSLLNPYMDFSKDMVNGEPRLMVEPYNSVMIDPNFTDQALTNCAYILRRRYVTRQEAKVLIPDMDKEIDSMPSGISSENNMFPYMPYDNEVVEDLMAYDEYWRRTTKPVKKIINRTSGENFIFDGTNEELKEFIAFNPFVKVINTTEPTVERVIFLQDYVMAHESDPYNIDDFPFVPVLGDYTSNYDRFDYKLQGIIRAMRDPNKEYNKLFMSLTDITRSQANSGYKYKLGSVKNPEDLGKTGQGVVIAMDKGAMMSDVEKIQAGDIPPSIPMLAQVIAQNLRNDAGISDELLGMGQGGNSQVSGSLAQTRAYNSETTLQDLFDGLNYSQKLLTEKYMKMMQANFTPERIQRITERPVPPNYYLKDVSEFDLSIEQDMSTETQRSLFNQRILQANAAGFEVPKKAVIEALDIQGHGKLMEYFEEENQAKQQQEKELQQQKELAMRLGNARVVKELSLAEQERRRGVADEKLAVWRESEAEKNIASSQLDQVKAVKEIQEMDINNAMKVLEMLQNMQNLENREDQATVQQSINQIDQSVIEQDAKATASANKSLNNVPPELLQLMQGGDILNQGFRQ